MLFVNQTSFGIKSAETAAFAIEKRIDKLLAQMTLAEKIGQMYQFSYAKADMSAELAELVRSGKVGAFLAVTDVKLRNKLQKIAVKESRLGIPLIFGLDVIHGYRTIFPIPLGQSATWDLRLAEKAAAIAAKEARSEGIDWTFAPMIDIARDPRWGRIAEGFGEDPYLCSLMAQAKVRGFQGKNLSATDTIVACLKHYVAYGAAEAGRDYNSAEVSERTLRDIYMAPFRAGVKAAAATVMSSFNDIGGVPASGNRFILTDVLRGEWGFDGFVVSDYESIKEMINYGIAADEAQAGEKAILAGVDMEMASRCFLNNLARLVKDRQVPEKVIDEAVRRILRVKLRAGLFEHPYVDPNLAGSETLQNDSLQIAREMVRKSLVLLKNDGGLLPLRKDIPSIAVIGPLADNQRDLLGAWCGRGKAEDVVTLLKGIKNKVSSTCRIHYIKGCDIKDNSLGQFDAALNIADKSDVVIMAVGESADMSGEAHCRTSLDLPGVQRQLIKAIHKTGKPVIVVLFTGRPLTISWLYENIGAVLLAWHPGIQGGNGIADVLFGDYNPSGKLAVTFPRNVGQVPLYYNHKNSGRPPAASDPFTSKYIDCPWTPLLPFGYGLSYTAFEYSNLEIKPDKVRLGQPVSISVEVENKGTKAGEEVVQLYIRDLVASVARPVKELKGFEKIRLAAGQKRKVSFTLTAEQLKFYDIDMKFTVEPGVFKVWAGPSSIQGLEGTFEIF